MHPGEMVKKKKKTAQKLCSIIKHKYEYIKAYRELLWSVLWREYNTYIQLRAFKEFHQHCGANSLQFISLHF